MVELIGIIGSAFICVAFLFKNVIWIRLFDSVGAIFVYNLWSDDSFIFNRIIKWYFNSDSIS